MELQELDIQIDDDAFLPVYKPLRNCTQQLRFVYGGRDSGKSRDRALQRLLDCLTKEYFRCILIKKTHNSIKDSQWQLIYDLATEYHIDHLFDFKTSPLEITCKLNGNKFLCRGMDKPAKIKSINEPSDVWIEEGNQLTLKDWIYIITTVRSSYGPVTIDMTFNTETDGDFNDFWLYKEYFAHTTLKSFTSNKIMKLGKEVIVLPYIAIHSTYHDNPYVDNVRRAWHESLSVLSYYWYRVFTMGEWGNEENDAPWLFAYKQEKHIAKEELFATRNEILYLSWDFNRNPQVCTVIQDYDGMARIIEVLKIPKVGTEGLCKEILDRYPNYLYMVTGDYSGDNESSIFEEEVTNYTMIQRMLNLTDNQIRIMPNPDLKKNQTLVNTWFHNYPVVACPIKAKAAKYDFEHVKKDAEGKIEKKNRKDPKQQADVLDTIRYFVNTFHGDFIQQNT